MAMTAAELVKADQDHLIHPLHHPIDNAEPMIYVRGRGAMIQEIGGHEYIDGLSGLWNVNVGHGRAELADAAAAQMKELAYFSALRRLVEHSGHHPGEQADRARLRQHAGGVLHLRRRRVERVGVQDRALLLEDAGQARQGQGHLAPAGLSRRDAPGDERHRDGRLLEDVRAARAGLRAHPDVLPVPVPGRQARRDRGAGGRARARRGDPARGPRHGRGIHRRAHPRRRRRHLSDRRLLAARARGLHAPQGALHRRRGHHGLLPDRAAGSRSRTGT